MKENAKSRMNINPVDNKLYFPAPCMLAHAPFHTARKFVPPTSHEEHDSVISLQNVVATSKEHCWQSVGLNNDW